MIFDPLEMPKMACLMTLDQEVKIMRTYLGEQARYDAQLQVERPSSWWVGELDIWLYRCDYIAGVILRSPDSVARVTSSATTTQTTTAPR